MKQEGNKKCLTETEKVAINKDLEAILEEIKVVLSAMNNALFMSFLRKIRLEDSWQICRVQRVRRKVFTGLECSKCDKNIGMPVEKVQRMRNGVV